MINSLASSELESLKVLSGDEEIFFFRDFFFARNAMNSSIVSVFARWLRHRMDSSRSFVTTVIWEGDFEWITSSEIYSSAVLFLDV